MLVEYINLAWPIENCICASYKKGGRVQKPGWQMYCKNQGLLWCLKSLHDSSVISFIMPQHTPNQTWTLPILQPVCRFSVGVGKGSKKKHRNTSSGDGDSISIDVACPQVEQIQHQEAGTGRWLQIQRGRMKVGKEGQTSNCCGG